MEPHTALGALQVTRVPGMSGKQISMYTTCEGLDTHDAAHPPQCMPALAMHWVSHTYRLALLGPAAELGEGMVPYAQGGLGDVRVTIIPWGGCQSNKPLDSCACILDSICTITSDGSKIIAILICIILLAWQCEEN